MLRPKKKRKTNPKLPQELRLGIYYAADGHCHYCGVSLMVGEFEVDHKHCRYAGGTDEPSNLVASCVACNGAKGTRTYRSFLFLLQRNGLAWRDQQYALRQELFKKPSTFKKALRTPWHQRTDLMRFALTELDLLAEAKKRRR